MRTICRFNLCLGLFLLAGVSSVYAAALEEVVVTASKRGAITVQDTIGSIRAVTGDFLEKNNLRSFEEIGRLEPSLQFSKAAIGDLQPIIRGVQSPGAGTVGVYFDETIITGINFQEGGGRTPDIAAYDIERVEILKGPQGTLFGASSLTGTVRFISNKPDANGFDANLRAGGDFLKDGDPGFAVDGMINIPVVEGVFAVRGVGWHESRGGFIDQFSGLNAVTRINNADEVDKTGGRIMARFTPNERLTLDAYALIQDIDVDGVKGFTGTIEDTGVGVPIQIVTGPPFLVGQFAPPMTAFSGERVSTTPTPERSKNQVHMYGFTGDYDLGFGSVLATVSKYNSENTRTEDTTAVAFSFSTDLSNFFTTGMLTPSTTWPKHQYGDREVFQSEIRFSSGFDGPFNFVAGFFYQEDERSSEFMVNRGDPVTGRELCARHRKCIADPTSPGAQTVLFATSAFEDVESFAVFANAEYKLTDAWTLGGGVRYFDSDEDDLALLLQAFQGSNPFTIPPANGGPVQTVPIVDFEGSTSESEVTWEASLGYHFTEDQLYYFKAATGFRQGGINKGATAAAQLGIIIPQSFGSDTVLSLEAGAKTSWFDDRLYLNLTYFKMFWDDVLVDGQDSTGTTDFLTNAAEAEIDGVEIEIFARPTDPWSLSFGVTWLDPRLTKDQDLGFDPALLGNQAAVGMKGDRLAKSPRWAVSGSAEYAMPFPLMNDVDMALRANLSYTGPSNRFFNDSFENNVQIGDYFLLNLSADFNYENWVFRVFANNVTDKVAAINSEGIGIDPRFTITTEPRSLGAQLQWNFR